MATREFILFPPIDFKIPEDRNHPQYHHHPVSSMRTRISVSWWAPNIQKKGSWHVSDAFKSSVKIEYALSMLEVTVYLLPFRYHAKYFRVIISKNININRYRNILRWWRHISYLGNLTPKIQLLPPSPLSHPQPPPVPLLFLTVPHRTNNNVCRKNERTRVQTKLRALGCWLYLRVLIFKELAFQLSNTKPGLIEK